MKLQGSFDKVWEHVKEGSGWVNIYGVFSVKGERDVLLVQIPRTKDWCIEHGLKTGASGEITLAFRKEVNADGTKEWYSSKVWEFKSQEQLLKEEEEREAKKAEQRPAPMEKTPEMVAAAEARMEQAKAENEGAQTDLPF